MSEQIGVTAERIAVRFPEKMQTYPARIEIAPGERVVVTGPSGAGKTTLLRLFAGLQAPAEGTLTYTPAAPRRIGMVFQEDRLAEHMSAADNLRLVNAKLSEAAAEAALSELLEEKEWRRPVRQLSGGERRRVCLLRALLSEGELLLFDEPFAGLDAETRDRALAAIERHRAGRTLVISAHDAAAFAGFLELSLLPPQRGDS